MNNLPDPRYRTGNCEPDTAYLWYLPGIDTPVAGYLEVDGYVAFYDFEAEICGSALSDINGKFTWEEFHTVYLPEIPPHDGYVPFKVENIRAEFATQQDPWTLLSINDVIESAFFYLLDGAITFSSSEERKAIGECLSRFQ